MAASLAEALASLRGSERSEWFFLTRGLGFRGLGVRAPQKGSLFIRVSLGVSLRFGVSSFEACLRFRALSFKV